MIPPSLNNAMKHFPEHKKTLENLYRQDESFRSLCEDFFDCVRAINYWCHSSVDCEQAPRLCEEYKILYEDLKKEIAEWLLQQANGD